MKTFTQPNGIPAEIVQYLTTDPTTLITGSLFQTTGGQLFRVAQGRVAGKQYIQMTKRDGTLKDGESRWCVEVKEAK